MSRKSYISILKRFGRARSSTIVYRVEAPSYMYSLDGRTVARQWHEASGDFNQVTSTGPVGSSRHWWGNDTVTGFRPSVRHLVSLDLSIRFDASYKVSSNQQLNGHCLSGLGKYENSAHQTDRKWIAIYETYFSIQEQKVTKSNVLQFERCEKRDLKKWLKRRKYNWNISTLL